MIDSDEVFEAKMVEGLFVSNGLHSRILGGPSLGSLVKKRKEVTLDLQVLDNGLDNEVSVLDSLGTVDQNSSVELLSRVGGGLNVGHDLLGKALNVIR